MEPTIQWKIYEQFLMMQNRILLHLRPQTWTLMQQFLFYLISPKTKSKKCTCFENEFKWHKTKFSGSKLWSYLWKKNEFWI